MWAAIIAFLTAATTALRAFPLWLAWRQWDQIEDLSDAIIQIEARAQPADRPRLERMRVKLANARKHHASLLAIVATPESRTAGDDSGRPIYPTG